MQSVYQSNPNLGDPGAIEGQLRESTQRLSKLQQELQKYQTYLNEMDLPPGQNNGQYGTTTNSSNYNRNSTQSHHNNQNNRSSGSDESLTRSASDLSQNNHNLNNHLNHHHNSSNLHKASAPGTPLPSHGYNNLM